MREQSYGASPIKRNRSTQSEMARFEAALHALVRAQQPMTVRQAFYRASVKGLVDKSEAGYRRVQRVLVDLRRRRVMPFSWLTDTSRSVYRVDSFDSPERAAAATARFYRKALWTHADCRVEVWLEKDALSGVIMPVTDDYDVGLFVCRGFASLSFLHGAAEHIESLGKPTYIYHLGDRDPSGVMAGEKIEETLKELAPSAVIHFERLAVTEEQVRRLHLPSRPTKDSTHSKGWSGGSVELDAIEPDELRALVRRAIERHLPAHQWEVLKQAEESERMQLQMWAGSHG